MKGLYIIFTLLAQCCFCAVSAQLADCTWARSSIGKETEVTFFMTSDAQGYIYTAGSFRSDSVTYGNVTLKNAGSSANGNLSFSIVKYDSAGNVAWAKTTDRALNTEVLALAVDDSGHVYFVGSFAGNKMILGGDTVSYPAGYTYNPFYAKCDANGNYIWVKGFPPANRQVPRQMICDHEGNLYMSGATNSTFITKYNPAGAVLWSRPYTAEVAYINGMAIGKDNDLYLAGSFSGSTLKIDTTVIKNKSTVSYTDMLLAKYSSDGKLMWLRGYGGRRSDANMSIVLDSDDNIYTVGIFASDTFTFDTIFVKNTSANGTLDAFVAGFDKNGNINWVKTWGGNNEDRAWDLALNKTGNVYVAGYFTSDTIGIDGKTILNTDRGGFEEGYMAVLDKSGNFLRVNAVPGKSSDHLMFMCAGISNDIYIAGFFFETVNFANITLTSTGKLDSYIARLDEEEIVTFVPSTDIENDLLLFPNPASQLLYVRTVDRTLSGYRIYNILGKLISTESVIETSAAIDISKLPAGLYFLSASASQGEIVWRFIKQ